METFTIKPRAPYNFKLSLDFLIKEGDGPFPEYRENDNLLRAFRINSKIIPVKIFSTGTVEKPELKVLTQEISPQEGNELKDRVISYLNLNEDLTELYSFMEKDERLKKIRNAFFGFKVPMMGVTVYEVIIKAIVQQQISLQVAFHMIFNLVKKFGEFVEFTGEKYYDFPCPATLANASLSDMRKCGLSRKKIEYIKDFSREVVEGGFDPEEMTNWEQDEIVERLTKFRGIGRWTAELVSIASVKTGKSPAGDLGVRKAISRYYFNEKLQDAETIRKFIKKTPRGLVVYLLYANRLNLDV